jgi:ubiquinone/menaquinone biosynthesis C-methylase UbiE
LRRIGALWQPDEWPEATDAYAQIGYRRSFAHHVARVRHLGLSGGLLLDAGCGGGRWSFGWATRFERVIGFDNAPRRLATATWQKERLDVPSVEFILGDVRKVPAENDVADVLYCNGVMLDTNSIAQILREFFRVLKPGGICYLGLNGLGLAYERMKSDQPRLATSGRTHIYNTLCRRHLTPLVVAIAPGGSRNTEFAEHLQSSISPSDLLTSLKCDPHQILGAETISKDLGPAYIKKLHDDLVAINAGTKADFGEGEGNCDWDAAEVSIIAREAGFGRSEWAPDGWLSLKSDGSIEKTPCAKARPGPPEFEGRTRVFEMLLWKPRKKVKRPGRRGEVTPDERIDSAEPKRTSDVNWKVKSGGATYWNAKPDQVMFPIIDFRPPGVTEIQGAVITPRENAPKNPPKEIGVRYARGAVYDGDHNILPIFLEREAFELTMEKGNRLKNNPLLPERELVDAEVMRGSYIYLGILRLHFGHFLLETLSRVWYLLKSDPNIKVLYQLEGSMRSPPSYMRYIFSLLDLDLDRVIFVKRTMIVENLHVPQSEFEIRWNARTSYADTFRELFERSSRLHPVQSTPRRIYLTRRQLNIKKAADRLKVVNNEAEVEKLFAARGFAVVAPEKLPLHEQIAMMSGARQIAGLKGSALHMSLFNQHPNARVIQIGRKQSMNQVLIDGLKTMESHYIFCESRPSPNGSTVDLEVVRDALREM